VLAALILGAYLLGAVPFGLLIGLARGVDIRLQGSRNIGATNAGRVLGRKWGYLSLLLDVLKGFVPTLTACLLLVGPRPDPREQLAVLAVALAAVLGHVFPIYLRFRGGKGVATTVGVALGVWPHFTLAMLAALAVYALLRFTTGMVSLGSLAIATTFPIAVYVVTRVQGYTLAEHWPLQVVSIALGLVIIVRHRENIRRLWRGEELAARGSE
jgi:glycerol-3-phosphate acyltransferase PlsY